MRKRRIAEQVLRGKNHGGTQVFFHPVCRLGGLKEPALAGRIQPGDGSRRVDAVARGLQVIFAGVCGKNLDVERLARQRRLLGNQHGEGIGFFPGRTARHPDADG